MVNSVFSALPTYYMCSLVIPPTVIQQIDRFRKHCLQSKGDINRKGTCLAAWEPACRAKDVGGLGIIDIKNQNSTLLLKFLDKFYNHANIPWVKLTWSKLYQNANTPPHDRSPSGSFWWKDVIKLFEKFKSFAVCHPNSGNSISFQKDSQSGEILESKYPELYSYSLKTNCSLSFYCSNETNRLFFLPLSIQASQQFSELQQTISNAEWDHNTHDVWHYTWGPSFSSRKAYSQLQGTVVVSPLFNWVWKSGNLGKHKFFIWLLIKDRLSTRNILKRKHMHLDDYSCVLCQNGPKETCFHLFFECPFSTDCWNSINIHWNFNLQPLGMIIQARTDFGNRIFREIFISACWTTWKARNGIVFDNQAATLLAWRAALKEDFGQVCIKAKKSIADPLFIWKENQLQFVPLFFSFWALQAMFFYPVHCILVLLPCTVFFYH